MVNSILEVLLLIVVLAVLALVGGIVHSMRGNVSSRSLRRDERYARLREVHVAGGKANQAARNEAAEIDIVNHHLKGLTRRDYRRAEAGNPKAEAKINEANRLADHELKIFRNKIVPGHRAASRIHPGTGQILAGIRREAAPRQKITFRKPKPSTPAKDLPKWRRPSGG